MSDFSTNPDTLLEENPKFKTLVSEFENGFEQRRAKWSSDLRTFKLVFTNRTDSEMETVRDFYLSKLGSYSSFTWTNPNDSVEYTVRFKEDSFNFIKKAYLVYDFSFEFVEVRS